MSKSIGKCRSTPNRQKFDELDIQDKELSLVRTKQELEQSKQECARRNI